MTQRESNAMLEILFVLAWTGISIAVFWESLSLPRSLREPLGSATVPQIVCAIVILFCAVLFVRSIRILLAERRLRLATGGGVGRPEAEPGGAEPPKLLLAAAIFVFGMVYVALLQARLVPAYLLTPVLLMASFLTLTRFRRSAIVPAAFVSAVVGAGVPLIFTGFFSVNLP